jgi:hypothetical protein
MYIIELITIVLFFIIGMTYLSSNKRFKTNNKLEENIRIYENQKKENR